MVTSAQCLKKYGDPEDKKVQAKWLTIWDVPTELEIGVIPKRIYCNLDMIAPLQIAFTNLIKRGFVKELKTYDGCWNIRKKRGLASLSLHSWAIAIDVNAAENGLGKDPKLSKGFVQCFTDAGFDWGGTWTRKDGMHFQLRCI